MTLVVIHVLADLMKPHFVPKFLSDFDQEMLEA